MTLRHGLFVSGAAAGVTAPQDARLALAGMLSGAGVITGGAVAGSTSGPNMKYTVAAGVFATARGTVAADGLYITPNDGVVTVDSGSPAPASGARYDVIYVLHRNAFGSDGFGDANSDPTFGVQVGTASSTPVVPSVPAGALAIAQALVGTNIATASLAVITQVAAQTFVTPVAALSDQTQTIPAGNTDATSATPHPYGTSTVSKPAWATKAVIGWDFVGIYETVASGGGWRIYGVLDSGTGSVGAAGITYTGAGNGVRFHVGWTEKFTGLTAGATTATLTWGAYRGSGGSNLRADASTVLTASITWLP